MPRWVDAAFLAAVGLVMLAWSWRRWPDALIDFGLQLYVPWRLAEGEVLYRDVAYLNGPLSSYLHAALFRLLGPGMLVLALANVALVGVVAALSYALLERIGSRVAALLGCTTFLLVFAFAQQLPVGNYNFVTPYVYEITHGVLVALAAAHFVGRFADRGRPGDAAAAGLCAGLAVLTKPEVLTATVGAASAGVALALWTRRPPPRRAALAVAAYAGALVVPALASTALLSLAMPPWEALASTAGGMRWLSTPGVSSTRFYRATMGLLDPARSLAAIGRWLAIYALLVGGAVLVALVLRRRPGARRVAAWLVFALMLAALLFWRDSIRWTQVLLPLPAFLLAASVVFAVAALRAAEPDARGRLVLATTLSLLSLGLLAKVVLRTRPSHYGFALAMPGTMVLIALLWDWVPRAIGRVAGAGRILRAAFLAGLAATLAMQLRTTAAFFATRTVRVGSGVDAFWADRRGAEVVWAVAELARQVPPGATLAVVPDGVMINYLARRANPTRHTLLNPVMMRMVGENDMLRSFRAHPPDFVLLLDWPMHEFGAAGFGDGYGERLAGWIGARYRPVGPLTGRPMVLLRRVGGPRGTDGAER